MEKEKNTQPDGQTIKVWKQHLCDEVDVGVAGVGYLVGELLERFFFGN